MLFHWKQTQNCECKLLSLTTPCGGRLGNLSCCHGFQGLTQTKYESNCVCISIIRTDFNGYSFRLFNKTHLILIRVCVCVCHISVAESRWRERMSGMRRRE